MPFEPFRYHKQPLAGLYVFASVLTILFIRIPYWLVTCSIPALRPHKSWSFHRSFEIKLMQAVTTILFNTGLGVFLPKSDDIEKDPDSSGYIRFDGIAPELVQGSVKEYAEKNGISVAPCAGFWLGSREGGIGKKADPGEKVIYHLHAGGFTLDTAHPKYSPTTLVPKALLEAAKGHADRMFAVEYRLASSAPYTPANHFPAALIDAVGGYNYLVNVLGFEPKNIVFSGDSAGGNLVHALTRYLVTNNLPKLPPPEAILMISPTMDWALTHSGPECFYHRNRATDFVGPILESRYTTRSLMGNIPLEDAATNEYISPGSSVLADKKGLYTGFPKACMVTGGAELTLDGMVTVSEGMKRDMGEDMVTYLEGAGCTHDFMAFGWQEPERSEMIKLIASWLDTVWACKV